MRRFYGYKKVIAATLILGALVSYAWAQDRRTWDGYMVFRQADPRIYVSGVLTFRTPADVIMASIGATGGGFRSIIISASSGSTTVTASQNGATLINTGTSATTTFVLPAASNAGLHYCAVENGNAAGELLLNVQTGDNVVGRGITDTAGTTGATAIATAANSGIKNTAASNVRGDFTCLVADGTTTWLMTAVMGVWATQ